MKQRWTIETAKKCLAGAKKGSLSLRQCGAWDFLRNRGGVSLEAAEQASAE